MKRRNESQLDVEYNQFWPIWSFKAQVAFGRIFWVWMCGLRDVCTLWLFMSIFGDPQASFNRFLIIRNFIKGRHFLGVYSWPPL